MLSYKKNRFILFALLTFSTVTVGQSNRFEWIKGVFRNPEMVGAIAPASSYTAKELARYIHHDNDKPIRILEVGSGTGPVTEEIIKKMNKADHLDCIELDKNYCEQLDKKFSSKNVHIYCMSITDFKSTKKYDVIISTLPFNLLSPQLVQEIVKQYKTLIKPGGHASYIEYAWLGKLKRLTLSKKGRRAWDSKQRTLKTWRKKYGIARNIVYRNLPPTYVYHLKM